MGITLTAMDGIERYVDMLEHLEDLVVRLRRAATIDRTAAATQEKWLDLGRSGDQWIARPAALTIAAPRRMYLS